MGSSSHSQKIFFGLALLAVGVFVSATEARYATPDDFPVRYDRSDYTISVAADGTYNVIQTQEVTLLKEAGRSFSPVMLTYHEDYEAIDVLEAKTIVNGIIFPVSEDHIEKKTLASDSQDLSSHYQIMIHFPRSVVGATLFYSYRLSRKKTIMPHSFYYDVNLTGQWIESSTISLSSEIPALVVVQDPMGALSAPFFPDEHVQNFTCSLKKTIMTALIAEPHGALPTDEETVIKFSSTSPYSQFFSSYAQNCENKITHPLPDELQTLANSLKDIQDVHTLINTLTSSLADQIHYLHDSRTLEGGLFPRDLEEIMKTGTGDCKDFSICTAAVLRSLGFRADPVLVYRGEDYNERIDNPTNHMILRVIPPPANTANQTSDVLWIDPTNPTSMAGRLYPDIAGRKGYMLSQPPYRMRIPDITENDGMIVREFRFRQLIAPTSHFQATHTFSGYIAEEVQKKLITESLSTIKDTLMGAFQIYDPVNVSIKFPENMFSEKTMRTVQNITVFLEGHLRHALVETNHGPAFRFSNTWPESFLAITPDTQGHTFVGSPFHRKSTIILEGVDAHNIDALNVNLTTPWASIQRTFHQTEEGIEMNEDIAHFKKHISPAEICTEEFQTFQKKVRKNLSNTHLLLKTL